MRLTRMSLLLCIALVATLAKSNSDDWPTRPVKIIVAYPAGGTVDVVARALAQKLGQSLGQSFYIENRPGGSGNSGADYAAKSAPDGYTLFMAAADFQLTISPHLDSNPPFQLKDFAPISLAADFAVVLSAEPALGVNNLTELIALAEKQPGTIAYASYGPGSTHGLVMEQLQQLRSFRLAEIPYRSSGQALPDLLSGRIQIALLGVPPTLPYLRSHELKALAVGAPKRIDALPDVPTISEQGFPGFEASIYACLFAPAGTPPEIVEKLQQESVRERFLAVGVTPTGSTPAELAARIMKDSARWASVIHTMRTRASQ
jgi:tripartite-type tricarboxylate transporter receptor subunit TctC